MADLLVRMLTGAEFEMRAVGRKGEGDQEQGNQTIKTIMSKV